MEQLINRLKNSDLKLIEKETGIPYDRMYKWVKGKAKPKTEDANTLLNYFHVKGQESGNTSIANDPGERYRVPRIEANPVYMSPNSDDYEDQNSKFIELPDGTLAMRVPIVPCRAQAGYLLGFHDPEYFDDMETLTISVLKRHAGTYLGFEVKGDSMTSYDPATARKSIYEGQIAIGRDLPKHHWKSKLHIHSNDAWIIVHKTEGILIKAITHHDVERGVITIHSLNPDFEDEDLFLDDIEQIFDVVQVVDKRR